MERFKMKKIFVTLFTLFVLLTPLFAEHRFQLAWDKDCYSFLKEEKGPVITAGFYLYPIHGEGGALTYSFEFPSNNNFHCLLGCSTGWDWWGFIMTANAGCLINLVDTENFNLDLQFLAKFGFITHLYNQFSLDCIISHKDDKAFFYGTGIHNTFRMVHFTNASPEVSSYKLAEQIGFQLFCGFVF